MKYFIYEDGGTVESEAVLQGMTLTGFLKINKDPFVSNEAVNKEYVDGLSKELPSGGVTTGIMSERRFPDMEGELTSNAGSGLISLSDTGVLVGTYPKVSVNKGGVAVGGESLQAGDIPSLSWGKLGAGSIPNTLSGYGITNAVNKNTGTILGTLRTTVHPLLPNDAVTKTYLDNKVSTVVGYNVGDVITGEWDTTPEGFLQCNGGEVDKDVYPVLYSVIGDKYDITGQQAGSGRPWEQQFNISKQSESLSVWARSGNIPEVMAASQAVVTKNRVYLLGGSGGSDSYKTRVLTALVLEDGSLGPWTNGPSLLYPAIMSQAVVIKNKLYVIGGGGFTNTAPYYKTIISAIIDEDGTIGTWNTEPETLPIGHGSSQVFVTKNRIYLIGGRKFYSTNDGGLFVKSTYSAPVNENGDIGPWVQGVDFPVTLGGSSIAVTKNRVFTVGGYANGANTNAIYTTEILENGTIGEWELYHRTLPGTTRGSNVLVTGNYLYVFSVTSIGIRSACRCPIFENGHLGNFELINNLNVGSQNGSIFATKNKIFLASGYDGGYHQVVQYSSFVGGLNDYSEYYDGSFTTLSSPSKFRLPIYEEYKRLSQSNYYIKY